MSSAALQCSLVAAAMHAQQRLRRCAHTAVLVTPQPGLLVLPPALVRERLDTAVALLQLPDGAAQGLALRVPGMLLQPPGLTRSHLLSLSAVLSVELDKATVAAAEVPQLLLLPPQELQARLDALSSSLNVSAGCCCLLADVVGSRHCSRSVFAARLAACLLVGLFARAWAARVPPEQTGT